MDQKSSLNNFVLDGSFGTSGTMVENPLSNVFSARASVMIAFLEEKGSGSFSFSLLKMASVIACLRENRCAAIEYTSSTHSLSAGHHIAWSNRCATIKALTRAFLGVDWSLVSLRPILVLISRTLGLFVKSCMKLLASFFAFVQAQSSDSRLVCCKFSVLRRISFIVQRASLLLGS